MDEEPAPEVEITREYNPKPLVSFEEFDLISYIGLVNVVYFLIWAVNLFFRHNRRVNTKDLSHLAKYRNKDTWAVITGGSDGIGLQIAKILAKERFNICIVARNP